MKDNNQVIQEFNELVNMTASELEKWLRSGDSNSAGWPKDNNTDESVGHDSGRKIVEILQANPKKNPEKYTEDQVQHMRKVVSYCKRHLAQEEKANNEKTESEVKKTKSYASLKNWGHDFLKGQSNGNKDKEDDGQDEEEDGGDEQVGDKRKQTSKAQKGANKKQETQQGRITRQSKKKAEEDGGGDDDDVDDDDAGGEEAKNGDTQAKSKSVAAEDEEEGEDEDEEEESDDDNETKDAGAKKNGKRGSSTNGSGKSAKKGPNPGDKVSWKWGAGHPEGKVLDVKEEKTTIKTKRGNEVSRNGSKEDPAVVLDAGKSKAIKSAHELD